MDRWQNRVAVVTGASSGIGAAIVKDLVASGVIVVAVARRIERIEEIRESLPKDIQTRFHAKKCDVSDEGQVKDVFEWVEQTLGGTDILVNNAGCLRPGQLSGMDTQLIREVLDTNVLGVVYCTQQAFKSMKARSFDGHIVLINSVLGHRISQIGTDVPEFNIYPSSKYAISAMTEIYRQEFQGFGTKVKITSVSPGVVDTEIVPEEMKPYIAAMLKPEDISSAVLYAIGTPPHVQVHEITVKPLGEQF